MLLVPITCVAFCLSFNTSATAIVDASVCHTYGQSHYIKIHIKITCPDVASLRTIAGEHIDPVWM